MRSTLGLKLASLLSLATFAVACGGSEPSGLAPSGGGAGGGGTGGGGSGGSGGGVIGEEVDAGTANEASGACTKIDFVFVIDNSGSMSEEQQNLATNFPRFVQAIESFRNKSGLPLDYRIAVTTTGITHNITLNVPTPPGFPFPLPPQAINERGDDGAFLQKSSCNMTRRWLEKGDANVAQSFACIAKVGTNGPSFEMPLEATKRSLNDRVTDGTNAGFLRQDALLAVILLTDEEDCSVPLATFTAEGDNCAPPPAGAPPISDYVAMLDTVKGGGAAGRSRWASAVIAGETDCDSTFGSAEKATRLLDFVRQAGSNSVFSSICSGDLSGALTNALNTFQTACNNFQPPR